MLFVIGVRYALSSLEGHPGLGHRLPDQARRRRFREFRQFCFGLLAVSGGGPRKSDTSAG